MTTVAEHSQETPTVSSVPPLARLGVGLIAGAVVLVSLFAAQRYGFFGDELYFLAAGRRLDFSYADQGPLLPLLAHLADLVAPGSLTVLRLPAVLLTGLGVVVAALIAREFGGGRSAQLLTAAGYATSPYLLVQGGLLATNTVDTVLWVLITWLVVRWVRTRADRLLFAAALVTAVDMQVKWLVPFLWLAIGVSVLVCGPRRMLTRPALWAGAAVVVASMVPSLLWQADRGWPQLAMGPVIAAEQGGNVARLTFVPTMLLFAGLLGLILGGYGTWRLCRAQALRPYRFLAPAMLLLVVAFLVQGGRPYYVVGMFAVLMAAGAVELTRRNIRRWAQWLVLPVIVVSAAVTVAGLPVTPADRLQPVRNQAELANKLTIYGEFGWPELADATAAAYHRVPAGVRARTVIVTDSYWSASALDGYRAARGLPAVYSPVRGFGYFGAPPDAATSVIAVGADEPSLRMLFGQVHRVGTANARLGVPGTTRDTPIWWCTGPLRPWSQAWPSLLRLQA